MQLFLTKSTYLQTFSGADADQRFARDDAGDDEILRERTLTLQKANADDSDESIPPPDQGDDDIEDVRNNSK